MTNKKVYEFRSYKDFLLNVIAQQGRRGFLADLAKAAHCSHSYLSQTIRGKPNLTPDQALAIGDFLALSDLDSEYFFTLVLRERAATTRLRTKLDRKLESLKEMALATSTVIKPSLTGEIPEAEKTRYFNSWLPSAAQVLTSCKNYQTPEAIAERLQLSVREVTRVLAWLAEIKLVKKQNERFLYTGKSFHLPTQDIHNKINHLNWRLRGLESFDSTNAIHYTSAFSISLEDWDHLRSDLLSFIESQRKKIQNSGSDDAFVFCCDLFSI